METETTYKPSKRLATAAMRVEDEWVVDPVFEGEGIYGDHIFYCAWSVYRFRDCEATGDVWYALKPIVENGELVKYEVVGRERLA